HQRRCRHPSQQPLSRPMNHEISSLFMLSRCSSACRTSHSHRTHRTCAAPRNRRATKMALSKTTRDHDEIRRWAEERGGRPAVVASTESDDQTGIIHLEFPGAPNANDSALEEISWDEWFEKFDASGLEFTYQDRTAEGEGSNFNKLTYPENARARGKSSSRSTRTGSSSSSRGGSGSNRSGSRPNSKSHSRSASNKSASSKKSRS